MYSMWAGKWTISGNCLLFAKSINTDRAEVKSLTDFDDFFEILVVVACIIVAHYNPTEPFLDYEMFI